VVAPIFVGFTTATGKGGLFLCRPGGFTMAGDWIAWVKGLTKRREVIVMAEALKIPRREVAACCMEWWEWCDSEGDFDPSRDCHVSGVTFVTGLSLIDEHVGVTGFGQAMADAGWAKANGAGELMHPKLGKWTGSAAKERLRANQRQADRRAKSRKCHGKNVTKTLPEKRREEKSIDPTDLSPLPPELDSDEFKAAWQEWLDFRRKVKRKPVSATAAGKQLKELADWGQAGAIASIQQSIKNDWQGLFPPDGKKPENERDRPLKPGERLFTLLPLDEEPPQ
jgi:hypothetical protein